MCTQAQWDAALEDVATIGPRAASRKHGIPYSTLQGRANKVPKVKPHYRIAVQRPDGQGKIRVCAIGDAHDSPRLPNDRFRWIGKHIRETKPDLVVQIGDMASLDSLCSYEKNDTLQGKTKPTFLEDMSSLKEALEALNDGLGGYEVEKHVTLGNHEDRTYSFMNRTPEIAGMLDFNLYSVLESSGWSYSPFGEFHFIGGVGFTHIPLNRMSKPFGGERIAVTLAIKSVFDIVFGHTHGGGYHTESKINHRHVTAVNLACALPHGHRERYARHSTSAWEYGIYDLTIQHGHIQRRDWIPMLELEEHYG